MIINADEVKNIYVSNAFRGYAQVDRWADTHCAFPIPDECP